VERRRRKRERRWKIKRKKEMDKESRRLAKSFLKRQQ